MPSSDVKTCPFEDVDFVLDDPVAGLSEPCPFHKCNHAQPLPQRDATEFTRLKKDHQGFFRGDDESAGILVSYTCQMYYYVFNTIIYRRASAAATAYGR